MKIKSIIILSLTTLLFQCIKEKEASKVEIKEVYFNKILIENEAHIHTGDSLSIFTHLIATEGLSEFSVEIHPNFNGHQHVSSRILTQLDTLGYSKVFKLSNKDTLLNIYNEKIPETTINGEYHLELILLDKKGKRQEKIIAFEVETH